MRLINPFLGFIILRFFFTVQQHNKHLIYRGQRQCYSSISSHQVTNKTIHFHLKFFTLAKVHCTFANAPPGILPIGESPLYFRQQTPWNFVNWRKYSGLSPIYSCTFAIGECPIGESLFGEIPISRNTDIEVLLIHYLERTEAHKTRDQSTSIFLDQTH